jgi:hypothetical protein
MLCTVVTIDRSARLSARASTMITRRVVVLRTGVHGWYGRSIHHRGGVLRTQVHGCLD